jgi:hypothetical protein
MGQSIGEHVAEIEAGGVTSLAEAAVRPSCLGHVPRVDGDHHNVGFLDQVIEFAPPSSFLSSGCKSRLGKRRSAV